MTSGTVPVVVVGAGPAGIAAVHRLHERGEGAVEIVLVTRAGRATHLPGLLDAALGEQPAERFSAPVRIPWLRLVAAEATTVEPDGVMAAGERIDAAAVIACCGLEPTPLPAGWGRVHVAADPAGAAAAAGALASVPGGRIIVGACSVPHPGPAAPYSLAMRLADLHRRAGRFTRVTVVTPEPLPLIGIGGDAPGFVMEACAGAGVELEGGFAIDLDASEDGMLRSGDGRELDYELAILSPPYGEPSGVASGGTAVAGDAAATAPCTAGVAAAQGRAAADAALARLAIADEPEPEPVEAVCHVLHAGGAVSRLHLAWPPGPPRGEPRVRIEGPSPDLGRLRAAEERRFLDSVYIQST